MLPKTAIIGATGFIGKHFYEEYRKVHPDCVGTSRDGNRKDMSYLDLASPNITPLNLTGTGHRAALILAGITKLAVCEQEKELTWQVNVDGVLDLVRQLADQGIKPVYFSSDIFQREDGDHNETSEPKPLNEYARQKAAVEAGIKDICGNGNYLIIRLSKTFSMNKGDGTLFDEMAANLSAGKQLRAAHDQVFSPVYVMDVVKIVSILQSKDASGVINVNPPEVWSRYDMAVTLAEHMGVGTDRIERISLNDLNESFKRPKNTTLNPGLMLRMTGYQFKPTEDHIRQIAQNWKKTDLKTQEVRI